MHMGWAKYALLLALACLFTPQARAASLGIPLDSIDDGCLTRDTFHAWIGDGEYDPILSYAAGRKCWTVPVQGPVRYLYVRVDRPDLVEGKMIVEIALTVLDTPGILQIDYDSYLFPWVGQLQEKGNTGKWKRFLFTLPDAGFTKRCNGADFRITSDRPFSVARIDVRLVKRVLPPDDFKRDWNLDDPAAFDPDRLGFAFGGMHWGKDGLTEEIVDREMQLARSLGFGWIRQWSEWGEIEEVKGEYDWSRTDYRLSVARKYGLKMLGQVGFCSVWAANAPDDVTGWPRSKYPPRDLADFKRFVKAVVSRYKDDVHHWEGWNEMNDVGSFWKVPPSERDPIEHYVDWQRTFYHAAKEADPDCVILTGGFADGANLTRSIANYYNRGLKDAFDVMNIHVYPADPRDWMAQQIEGVIRVMRHYGDGDKQIWITETGWPVDEKHPYRRTLEDQAEWAPWLAAVPAAYPQVERVFFFELRDRAEDGYYGWFDKDFNPRPVVDRWQNLRKRLFPR